MESQPATFSAPAVEAPVAPNGRSGALRVVIALGVVGSVVAVLLAFSVKRVEIDLLSGQTRTRWQIVSLPIVEQFEDSSFSKFLQNECGHVRPAARVWRAVNERGSLQRISPHFVHHSSLYAVDQFMKFRSDSRLGIEREREMARDLLRLLQSDLPYELDEAAEQYCEQMLRSDDSANRPLSNR